MALLEIFRDAKIPQDWKIQIIGDGSEKQKLEKFVNENQLKERVIFYGTKTSEEILKLLRKSKIFGFTSLKEALPTVLVEAMFCGNAVIAYNCNYGPADIIKENCGFLIPINNKDFFIKKLEELITHPQLLAHYMYNSVQESKLWTKENIKKKWIDKFL